MVNRIIIICIEIIFFFVINNSALAKILEVGVPGYQYNSIQKAIDDAANGDKVIVYNGFYSEDNSINFQGKAITVRAENHQEATIMVVLSNEIVIKFDSNETSTTILDGFNIILQGSYHSGVGIYCFNASPTIKNCKIASVNSFGGGTGIYCNNAAPTIKNCIITGNHGYGGGIYCYKSSASITNCSIIRNSGNSGGGITCEDSSPEITNCIIYGNDKEGISCYKSSPIITNCTIMDNIAKGIYSGIESFPIVVNSIIWENEIFGSIDITYSVIQGGYGDPNITFNINQDPLFIDPNAGNFYLMSGSPCIDKGLNQGAPNEDKDGLLRPNDGDEDGMAICDIGGYEYVKGAHVFSDGKIQTAINAANQGDVIIIHPGHYLENINFLGKSLTLRSTNPESLSIVGSTIIDGNQTESVIKFIHSEGNDSVLKGITIQNGKAQNGGGIYCSNSSSPLISDCVIKNNIALNSGGGIFCTSSSPKLIYCTIIKNEALDGGGISCYFDSSPTIMYSEISYNTAHSESNDMCGGGGLLCGINPLPTITHVILSGNMVKESENQICLIGNSHYYSDLEIMNYKNNDQIYCHIYDQNENKWKSHYRFFGKPSGSANAIQDNDILLVLLFKE